MKIICPNCGKVIDSKKSDQSSYCKHCTYKFNTVDGENLLIKKYKFLQNDAKKKLFNELNFEESFKEYKECLEYKPNDIASISGMCMNKIISSTFNDFKYLECKDLFEQYDIVLDKENTFLLLNFLKDLVKYIGTYYREANARLIDNGVFLNLDYLKMYVKNNEDIMSLLEYFKETLTLVDDEEFSDFVSEVDSDFKDNFRKQYELAYKIKNETFKVNGLGVYSYDLNKVDGFDKKLDINKVEDMRIFVPDEKFLKLRKSSFVTISICFIALIGILIAGFVTKINWIYVFMLIPLAIGGVMFYFYYKSTK